MLQIPVKESPPQALSPEHEKFRLLFGDEYHPADEIEDLTYPRALEVALRRIGTRYESDEY